MIALLMLSALAGAPGDVAVVGGRVVTVSGPVIERGTVLVQGGKIAKVGTDVAVPPDAKVIAAEGRWVTPGFVEAGTQVGAHEISAMPETMDVGINVPEAIRASLNMVDAINPRSLVIPVVRRQGVTSVVVTPAGGLVSGRSAWLDLVDGEATGWSSAAWGPVAMHATLGPEAALGSRAYSVARLRELFDDARLFQKQGAAFERNALRKLAASRLDLAATQDVLTKKLPLVIAANRAAEILRAVELGRAEGVRVVVKGAAEGWLVARELAAAGVPVLVEPLDNTPASFDQLNSRADNASLLAAAGVELILTTDTSHLAGTLRFVAGNAVRAGLPHDVALRAVTWAPAHALGASDRYGALEAGKVANRVVWTGDPFEPSSAAEVVLVKGAEVSVESRQTKLRARYQARLGL